MNLMRAIQQTYFLFFFPCTHTHTHTHTHTLCDTPDAPGSKSRAPSDSMRSQLFDFILPTIMVGTLLLDFMPPSLDVAWSPLLFSLVFSSARRLLIAAFLLCIGCCRFCLRQFLTSFTAHGSFAVFQSHCPISSLRETSSRECPKP